MEKKPALEVTLVQEFVSKSHADLNGGPGIARPGACSDQQCLGLGRWRLGNRPGRRRTHGQA